jgi:hypothetical protein
LASSPAATTTLLVCSPVSERTPRFRNIRISGVTAHADQAGTLLGLEEARLDDVTLTDIDIVANTGFVIKNANHVTLRSVRIHTQTGPAIITERSNDVRLFDVGTLAPHAGTPAVEMINVEHAFVQGSSRRPAARASSVRDATRSIIIGSDLADARAPVVIGGRRAARRSDAEVDLNTVIPTSPTPPWTTWMRFARVCSPTTRDGRRRPSRINSRLLNRSFLLTRAGEGPAARAVLRG